jgi:diguanylate cyclase (GGDEF)-like protein
MTSAIPPPPAGFDPEAHSARAAARVEPPAAEAPRDLAADDRDAAADLRDEAADRRDEAADDRDTAADGRDSAAGRRDTAADGRDSAADDRDTAADDRDTAAGDRDTASDTDELTGALRRRRGFLALQHEMDRCQREGSNLVIAFLDVDAMKQVNDTRGHQAGDQLLREVAEGLRASLRSYDVLMRFGGDEFVYSVAGAELNEAATRFAKMRASLARIEGDSVSAGFAELRPGDTLDTLIGRADADLYERRKAAGHESAPHGP